MWPELAFGVGTGQAQLQAYSPQMAGYNNPFSAVGYIAGTTTTSSHDLYIGSNTEVSDHTHLGYEAMKPVKEKPVEPPDEFTQLSNHKFHELLDRFSKLT